ARARSLGVPATCGSSVSRRDHSSAFCGVGTARKAASPASCGATEEEKKPSRRRSGASACRRDVRQSTDNSGTTKRLDREVMKDLLAGDTGFWRLKAPRLRRRQGICQEAPTLAEGGKVPIFPPGSAH